jgi:hypothetical protein
MSKVSIEGNASGTGTFTIASPNSNTNRTLTLPDSTGTVVVSGTTPSLNGITFPATQVASAGANTLDDYEEGTFTPSLTFGSGSVSYGVQEATYTKIGRLVNCTIAFEISSVASPSGNVGISGLPFSNGSGERFVSGASIGVIRSMVTSNAFIRAYVGSGGTTIVVASNANNASASSLQGSEIQANTLFYLSVTFNTA